MTPSHKPADPAPELDDSALDSLLALAVDLADRAARRHRQGGIGDLATKSSVTDPVTEVDRDSEALIVSGIRSARPRDGILGEEGASVDGVTGLRWIIDPLDGTVNYLYGIPCHAVSISVEEHGVPIVGVVHDTAHDEVFAARRGGGATFGGRPIRGSDVTSLSSTLLGTGFGYDAQQRHRQGRVLAKLIGQVRDIRRAGSCAVDLCWAAMGRLDAFYETGPNRWDVSAGMIIVREAGGVATYDPSTHRILAAPPALWNELVAAVSAAEAVLDPS